MSQWGKPRAFGACTFVPYFGGKPFEQIDHDSIIHQVLLIDIYKHDGQIPMCDVQAANAFVGKRCAEWDAGIFTQNCTQRSAD